MSSLYHPSEAPVERQLTRAVAEVMGVDFDFVTVAVLGRRVVLQGSAPSYVAKARAANCVRQAGFSDVDNRLRVAPCMPAAGPVLS